MEPELDKPWNPVTPPPSENAYDIVLGHRRLRVNFVQLLNTMLAYRNGKAEMNIPLVQMLNLQVVRPALAIDIEKMKADFIHGYRPGAAVFYVSTLNFTDTERLVTADERAAWGPHWCQRDREFEEFLLRDPELRSLSNKYFFVWDRNHRLIVWMEFIAQSYLHDIHWHYRVRSIVLQTKGNVVNSLTAMHNINKATENSHVKTNLVHTLHRMRKVGWLEISNFKDLLLPKEMTAAAERKKDEKDTGPWYILSRAKFLEYIYSVSILTFFEPSTQR